MKMIKWGILSIVAIPVVASAVAVPIFVSNTKSRLPYSNIFTTYDNAQDHMIALGYAPDYDNISAGINHASYLDPYSNDELTKYVNIRIMDGDSVNRQALDQLEVDTIIVNEWMKADAYKFDGVVNNVAYTSMGDSPEANYHFKGNDIMKTGGYAWEAAVSIDEAFRMEASDLSRVYKKSEMITQSEDIIKKNNERIAFVNKNNRDKLSGKTIGFIVGAKEKKDIAESIKFYNPYVYPMIYSKTVGIGMEFPEPKDAGFIDRTHGYDWAGAASTIRGDTGSQLLEQFKGKFDYLIYCTPDVSFNKKLVTKEDVVAESKVTALLKDSSKAEQNILFSNQGQWYQSAWGIIGKKTIVDGLVSFLSLKDIDQSSQWEPEKPKELKRLRL